MPTTSADVAAATPAATAPLVPVQGRVDDRRHAYRASSHGSRDIGFWRPPLKSADAEIIPEAPAIRARARALVRNNPLARQAVRISRIGSIGPKMRLSLQPDYRFLGLTFEEAHDFATEVERLWESYAHGPDFLIDAGRRMNFTQIMGLVHDCDLTDGEALVAVEWDPGRKWKTCFQVIDVDRLSNPPARPESVTCRGGVELDRLGVAIGYHVKTRHPNDYGLNMQSWQWDFIARETAWGRPVMCHTFDVLRPSQTRGVSEFASVIPSLKMGAELDEATLQTAILQTCLAIVLKSPATSKEALAMLGGGDPSVDMAQAVFDYELDRLSSYGEFYNELDLRFNGSKIAHLAPGDELDLKNAGHPSSHYIEFQKHQGRNTAAGLGVDPVATRQDYSDVNFSSARMAQANNDRVYTTRRDRLVHQVGMQMLAGWMEEAVMGDILALPKGIDKGQFYEARDALVRGRFITAGAPMIDPVKERQAQQMGMAIGVETLDSVCSSSGDVWDEVLEQQARENRKRAELGLLPPAPGSPPPAEPDDDDDKKTTKKDKS